MADLFSPYLLRRARAVTPGACVVCGCTEVVGCSDGCRWEQGTGERLCSAHTDVEKHQARAALAAADKERAPRRPRRSTRTTKEP